MINWKLETIPIKQLKNHSKNPRQIGKEQFERLGNLIDKFGLIDKPIVNQDMTLIGGHQRVRFLKKKKVKSVDCWVAEEQISEEDIDELCIGLNLHQGNWDWDILANQWEPLDLLKYGFSEEKLLGTCKEAEEVLNEMDEEEKSSRKKKQKCCPNCGHEF
jgi:ParB-like chromosome segregation protein Spo0J